MQQSIPIPQKIYNKTKRFRTLEDVEKYFPGFIAFIDSTEQQQMPRPIAIKDGDYSIQARRKDMLL
ncbi:MAG TPA: hypothetical protein VIY08_00100 [Candidatus Nitrosocosmicus sp.]